ncbi:MAG: diguanylate cyclase [Aquabacterium sp.]|uniref:sensor domain-containing diguanylate cyclase n=1 Tax=Aquabacterium sp. TaxID=1872578 RepID=UPI0025B7F01C|nr:7TM diverse intracellular signaling domain-containing protein [Aquabacterium sp.]MBI5925123.1 diguanylate cyclase [Aquabacterium sp.]
MAWATFHRCWARWLALTLLSLLAANAWADIVKLDDQFTSQPIGRHLRVLDDPTGKMRLADVEAQRSDSRWEDRHSDNLNFGYSRSALWLHGELVNVASEQQDWLLGMRYPLLDYLDIYVVWPDGRVQHHASGDRRPFHTRSLADRNFYFKLKLRQGDHVQLYVRVQGQGSLQAPLEVSTPAAYERHAHVEQLLLGIYSGALLAMLVYNLLLCISLRDKAYLHYVVYISLFGMTQYTLSGLAFETLWPNAPNWGNQAAPIFMGLAGWSLVLFSRQFLDLRTHWPRADLAMQALQWLYLAAVPETFVLPYAIPIKIVTLATIVTPVLLLIITVGLLRKGVQQARYFLAAFTVLLLGVLLTSLHMFGIVQRNFLTEYSMQIGSMLEFTLLSFALAHRVKLAREEYERLQLAHATELEHRVQDRTRDLDKAMTELTKANERLQELTEQDALTGLKNRMFLSERMPEVWRQAQRWHTPVSVLMIDVDHFKRVNDDHGHLAGDEALKQVAGVIAHAVQRPGDHALRYGGEEFLVLLPQTHTVGAAHIAETIRLGVQSLDFRHEGKPIPLTVSIGLASVVPTIDLPPQALLNAADQLLYQAKQNGRNRCALNPQALATMPRKSGAAHKPQGPATPSESLKPAAGQPDPASSARS